MAPFCCLLFTEILMYKNDGYIRLRFIKAADKYDRLLNKYII